MKYLRQLRAAVFISLLFPLCARADAGVPMLVLVWPASWMLLLAIIPIEAAIAFWLIKLGWKQSFKLATIANLASTLLGIPLTWIALVILQMTFGGGRAYGLDTDLHKLMAVTLQSPWLIPYEEDLDWMVPAAAMVLCVPFFFSSVVGEYFVARRFVDKDRWSKVRLWSWIANGLTYALILSGLAITEMRALRGDSKPVNGFIDRTGKFRAQPKNVIRLGDYSEHLAPFEVADKLWGFMDSQGKSVVNPRYGAVRPYSEGLAAMRQGDKWGFVDAVGKIVIQARFDEVGPFKQSFARARADKEWGYVDKTGEFVIKPKFEFASDFAEGLAAVKSGGKYGYINKSGEFSLPPIYPDNASAFSEGLACVHERYIDHLGKVIFTLPDECWGKPFSQGYAFFHSSEGSQYGLVDKKGVVVIPPSFDEGESFSEGLAAVQVGVKRSPKDASGIYQLDDSAARYGFIDKAGKFVVPAIYLQVHSFSEGVAAVSADGKRWGFIDKTGHYVLPSEYCNGQSFHQGLAAVAKFEKAK